VLVPLVPLPYSGAVRRLRAFRAICAICVLASGSHALAGGLVITGGSPRAIGRAGTGTVGDDGSGALLVNPAALARRETLRVQLGVAIADDELAWYGPSDAPTARDQAGSPIAPAGAVIGAVGPWVIGAGAMTASVIERQLGLPRDLPASQLANEFEYRYAGIAGALRRDAITLGLARRLGDSVAVGLAVAGSRITLRETRRVWAGFAGRDTLGDPALDVTLGFEGDAYAASAVAGVLVAPLDTPLELAASLAWMQTLDVDAAAAATSAVATTAPRVELADPSATLRVQQPWTARAGARYLGERYVIELGGDLWIYPRAAAAARPSWEVSGITIVDRSGVATPLARLPSRLSQRKHGAIRGAVDVELIAGFLWATTGYAYTTGATASSRLSPSFGDLGGHTLALGLEGTAGGVTLAFGWSRTWSIAHDQRDPALRLDNPFAAGDLAVPRGSYDGSIDQIGLLLDVELGSQ